MTRLVSLIIYCYICLLSGKESEQDRITSFVNEWNAEGSLFHLKISGNAK